MGYYYLQRPFEVRWGRGRWVGWWIYIYGGSGAGREMREWESSRVMRIPGMDEGYVCTWITEDRIPEDAVEGECPELQTIQT